MLRKYYIRPSIGGRQVFCLAEQGDQAGVRHTGAMLRRRSWPSMIRRLLVDVGTLVGFAVTSRSQLAAENLFLRKQLALLPRAKRQAKTAGSGDASGSCPALTPAGLARAPHGGPARHAHPVASSGLAAPLAVEVAARTAADPEGPAATDREHGPGEPGLG